MPRGKKLHLGPKDVLEFPDIGLLWIKMAIPSLIEMTTEHFVYLMFHFRCANLLILFFSVIWAQSLEAYVHIYQTWSSKYGNKFQSCQKKYKWTRNTAEKHLRFFVYYNFMSWKKSISRYEIGHSILQPKNSFKTRIRQYPGDSSESYNLFIYWRGIRNEIIRRMEYFIKMNKFRLMMVKWIFRFIKLIYFYKK